MTEGRFGGVATLVAALQHHAARQPSTVAFRFLVDGERSEVSITFGELDRKARAVAGLLHDRGGRGERAMLLFAPGLDYIIAFFGCLYAGVVAVPAYPPNVARLQRTLPRLQAIVDDADAKFILTTRDIASAAEMVFLVAPDLARRTWLTTDDAPEEGDYISSAVQGHAIAFLQYTSGSTGTPKGVMLTHANLLHNIGLIVEAFEPTPDTTNVSWLPPYHDMGLIGGILTMLVLGGTSVLMSPISFLQRPMRWLEAISRYRGYSSGGPNFAYDLCVRKATPDEVAALNLASWELAFSGAEPVRVKSLDAFAEAFASTGFERRAFYPCYGLAEATLIVSGGKVSAPPVELEVDPDALARDEVVIAAGGKAMVGCGAPLGGQEVAIVDPATGDRLDGGLVGEIWVAGPSVSSGYWRNEEATRSALGATLGGRRFLRTGDLGFLHAGELVVTGRLKDLIILRGRNLYPQDIEETAERAHPALRRGCCAAFAVEVEGQEELGVVLEVDRRWTGDYDEALVAVRREVGSRHDVAVHAVVLVRSGTMPKTSSGKIQRRETRTQLEAEELEVLATSYATSTRIALDSLAPSSERAAVSSRSTMLTLQPTERSGFVLDRLRELVATLTGAPVDEVPADRPLPALGLDSLMAVELSNVVSREFEARVPMALFLEDETLEGIVDVIVDSVRGSGAPSLRRRGARRYQPSYNQQRLWVIDQLRGGDDPTYNLGLRAGLRGQLDLDLFLETVDAVQMRHEPLRSRFVDDGDELAIEVADHPTAEVRIVDLSRLPPRARAAAADELARREAVSTFDLRRNVMRVVVVRHTTYHHEILLGLHHVAADGWSANILLRELDDFYRVRSERSPIVEVAPHAQYGDFAEWQRELAATPLLQDQLAWWKQTLVGLPDELTLPRRHGAERKEAAAPSVRIPVAVSTERLRELQALCLEEGATLFMGVVACFAAALARFSNQRDIAVGVPVTGRPPEVADCIGFFANTLVLRVQLTEDPTFRELLTKVRAMSLEAYARQDVPFSLVVDEVQPSRQLGREPIFQAMLVGENFDGAMSVDGTQVRIDRLWPEFAQFDVTLSVREDDHGISGHLEYKRDLLEPDAMESMAQLVETLVGSVAAHADAKVLDVVCAPAPPSWNRTAEAYPEFRPVSDWFLERAQARPDSAALTLGETTLTYGELAEAARGVAAELADAGVRRGDVVGVYCERSIELVVALLGTMMAGAAYMPLATDWPRERLAKVIARAGARYVLVAANTAHGVAWLGDAALAVEPMMRSGKRSPLPVLAPDDACHVIFTSGSTGEPKGVVNRHGGLENRLLWMQDLLALGPEDNALQKTPFTFDVSVWEFFWPLMVGARLVIAPPGAHRDPLALAMLMRREDVHVVHFVPSMLVAFLEEPEAARCGALRSVVCSGEALSADLVDDLHRILPATQLYNLYGPTEASIDVSYWHCVRGHEGPVPIGSPIANTEIHILDKDLRPLPVGVVGELYLGGAGVAREYVRRPGLTAERFIPDPFRADGSRLYRTGDLGRRERDGTITFLGRADQQVKIRGFRVELGEVEAAIRRVPGVRDAAVVASGDTLVAFYTHDHDRALTWEPIASEIAGLLPPYMVPARGVEIAELPLTRSGKLDRKALLSRESLRPAGRRSMYAAPQTRLQDLLVAIWRELLGEARVGIDDDLFELGADSIRCVRVRSRLRAHGHELDLRDFFEHTTVRALAAHLEDEAPVVPLVPEPEHRGRGLLIPRGDDDAPVQVTSDQRRMWFFERLVPGANAFIQPSVLEVRGPLDAERLERAFEAVVVRHEALRTCFREEGGELVATVAEAPGFRLERVELADVTEAVAEARVDQLVASEERRPFDLGEAPLLRATLVRRRRDFHLVVLAMHHIATDGWSLGVLAHDLSQAYEEGGELPPAALRYRDYAAWRASLDEGGAHEAALEEWARHLAGAEPLAVPTDHLRPAMQRYHGATHRMTIPHEVVQTARRLGNQEGASLNMVVLAAWAWTLASWGAQRDLVIGTAVANRDALGLEDMVGLVMNVSPLRLDVAPRESFRRLLRGVRAEMLEVLERSDTPFDQVVEAAKIPRDLSRSPLVQSMFVFQNTPRLEVRLGEARVRRRAVARRVSHHDVSLYLELGEDGSLAGEVEYATALFEAPTIERLAQHFVMALRSLVVAPDEPLAAAELAGAGERDTLRAWEHGAASGQVLEPAVTLFARAAKREPDHPALVHGDRSLSYGELAARVARLAGALRDAGVGRGEVVALALPRSIDFITAVLALHRLGAAYLPLDPSLPEARKRFVVDDAGVGLVVVADDADTFEVPARTIASLLGGGAPPERRVAATEEDVAYVIYTSGSTGRPKGVVVPQGALSNFAAAMVVAPGIEATDRVSFTTSPSFDISALEFLVPLTVGATVVVVDADVVHDGARLGATLRDQAVTLAQGTPGMWSLWVEAGMRQNDLVALVGGEACSLTLAAQLAERTARLHNMYGPTETTIWSSTSPLREGLERVTIGRPIQATDLYVLNEDLRPVAVGCLGELYVGGAGVAHGYHGRPGLTAERFVPDPFGAAPGRRLYRTGDHVRWTATGELEFVQRRDFQVKIRGHRIELGEIDEVLAQQPRVREACTVVRTDFGRAGPTLVSFVAGEGLDDHANQTLRGALRERMPVYMVPALVAVVERLPRNPAGKVDRRALVALPLAVTSEASRPLAEGMEQLVGEVWREALGRADVSPDASFFDLGGHSLVATKIAAALGERLDAEVPVRLLFEAPILADYAVRIELLGKRNLPQSGPIRKRPRRRLRKASGEGEGS